MRSQPCSIIVHGQILCRILMYFTLKREAKRVLMTTYQRSLISAGSISLDSTFKGFLDKCQIVISKFLFVFSAVTKQKISENNRLFSICKLCNMQCKGFRGDYCNSCLSSSFSPFFMLMPDSFYSSCSGSCIHLPYSLSSCLPHTFVQIPISSNLMPTIIPI